MSRCYECAEIEGFCTCIEKRIREQIAKEIAKLELWKYAKNGKEELDLRLAIKDAIYGGIK